MEIYKWNFFYSNDSYEYVMCSVNCFGMSFADGGMTMGRMYLCSSNYY